jgi:magnesium transporter
MKHENRQILQNRLKVKKKSKQDLKFFFHQPGTIPGTLRICHNAKPSVINLIDYSPKTAFQVNNLTPQECLQYLDTESVSWLDVQGLGSEDVLKNLGEVFELHPLVLEDIVNVPQRPKVEDYEDQLLIVTQMVIPKEKEVGFWLEQVSFILAKHYLLTVQEEGDLDCFQTIRTRILANKGSLRDRNADYLAYTLWNAIIEGYFPVLELYGEQLEALEEEVVVNPSNLTLSTIHQIKRELLALRRAIWPQRDAINSLIRDESALISSDVYIYLRDCYDRIVQIVDIVETYRELTSSLTDVYLSSVSNRMNEIMKVLTIISTIFIPLTFIAGVYGMNFENMPELKVKWAYFATWGVMIAIGLSLGYYFWRKGWFRSN